MNAKIGIRGLVAGLAFLLLPVGAFGHEIVPWGTYPSAGDVTIATKSKALLDRGFIGQILRVSLIRDGSSVYEVGTGLSPVYGRVTFTNAKGSKAKLTVEPTALDPWILEAGTRLREYLENKGDKVQDVTVTPKIAGGTATFKTKPTPIGPLHKASVSITIKFTAVATLEGGTTKRGTVTMTVTSKGARLGIPGGD